MTTLDALVLAAASDPGDETPRLILADHLEECGRAADAARLRLPGRWEAVANTFGPWRLYWCPARSGRWDGRYARYCPLGGDWQPPTCGHADCRSGWRAGVTYGGRWLCWPCAAREARRTGVPG